jgi:hypothetical protein
MTKASFGVGGGGITPALTARKLGMTPRMRLGCSFAGEIAGSAGFVLDWFGSLTGGDVLGCAGCGFCAWLCASEDAG